jgi:hypothetical protein
MKEEGKKNGGELWGGEGGWDERRCAGREDEARDSCWLSPSAVFNESQFTSSSTLALWRCRNPEEGTIQSKN